MYSFSLLLSSWVGGGSVTLSLCLYLNWHKTKLDNVYNITCKGYNTTVHTYWGKGQAVFSDQAVRAGWGLYNHLVQTSLPPILQRRRLKSRDGRSLIRVPARLGLLLYTIQVFLLEASASAWGSVSQSAREHVISWAPVIDAHYCTQNPEKVMK